MLVLVSPFASNGNPDIVPIQPEIQLVIFGGDSVLYDASKSNLPGKGKDDFFSSFTKIPHKYNSVLFLIDTLGINKGLVFQFFLDGFDDEWGMTMNFPIKEYFTGTLCFALVHAFHGSFCS